MVRVTATLERPLERSQTSRGTLGRRTSRMAPRQLYTPLGQDERLFHVNPSIEKFGLSLLCSPSIGSPCVRSGRPAVRPQR